MPLAAAVVLLGIILALMMEERSTQMEEVVEMVVEGPEVVVGHRQPLREAVEAMENNDSATAITTLESFSFGERAAEPYRLYLLANAYSLAGDVARTRRSLEHSWRRNPSMVVSADVAFHLIGLYRNDNNWSRVASLADELAEASDDELLGSTARKEQLLASFYRGDPGGAYRAALDLTVSYPESSAAEGTLGLIARMRGRPEGETLDSQERLARAERLLEKRLYPDALDLATRIDYEPLGETDRVRLALLQGQALGRMGRHKESEQVLSDLFSGPYRFAIPALEASARNRRPIRPSACP